MCCRTSVLTKNHVTILQKQVEDLTVQHAAIQGELCKVHKVNTSLMQVDIPKYQAEIAALMQQQALPPKLDSVQAKPTGGKEDQGQSGGGCTFEEFVMLKKENKELKLEILKLSEPSSKLNRISKSKSRTGV